ncbi:diglucosylglycerate octanoyltransferase [Streptoalloteichus hindustanus]|uniref:Lysophospholipase L1 n=1 Tax=Streptoalloteichus hindustanus TaxID=2017 RepID=A0A1M5BMQ5_STRHI|nr:diglucosylglycerate octanoyltransferase [Streptoalloteichus hindustanus]SHF43788.1 Lysophospholipase L1 [Streptoalloteichus hindustanus]
MGDSLAFHGPGGPLPADDTRLWPNVAAAALDGRAELVAGIGWTARDAWWSLTRDPRVWALLPSIDVFVLAVGSMDTLPSPLPTALREGIRYLRPDRLRRWVRRAYVTAQPHLARVLRGRPVALPPALTVRYLDRCWRAVRALRPDLPVVGIVPSVHRSAAYAYVHTGHAAAVAAVRAWSARRAVPLLDLPTLVRPHLGGTEANPDGLHWGWPAHRVVGRALAETITRVPPGR